MKLLRWLPAPTILLCVTSLSAQPQEAHNLSNARFNTVASGPMQALVVDIVPSDTPDVVAGKISDRVRAARNARRAGVQRYLDLIRRTYKLKGPLNPGIPDVVLLRSNGTFVGPTRTSRDPDPTNELLFRFPVSTAASDGGWTSGQAARLSQIATIMYPVLKAVYGRPFWKGNVDVLNGDNQTPGINEPDAQSGGTYIASNGQIILPLNPSDQSTVYHLTQMMALAFHGMASMSYDAWERGMARAAVMESVRQSKSTLEGVFGVGSIDLGDPLWHALDRYDLLNQPPLGNDRFYPVSKAGGIPNTNTFPNMLIPRLMMSGSAWLQVLVASPNFLQSFNNLYYDRVIADAGVSGRVPDLRAIAASVLGGTTINGLPFQDWYTRQFVLDTSVSPGYKLYAEPRFLRPLGTDDDYSIAVILYYYLTQYDAAGNSDEKNMNGTIYPIYWDFPYDVRLFLGVQYDHVEIRDGLGAVAPTFFNTIGGDSTLEGKMRITMDFSVNNERVRLYTAPRSMGSADLPNNFFGAVVGLDTGKIKLDTDTGISVEVDVKQGAFGAAVKGLGGSDAFSRPTRGTVTIKNELGAIVSTQSVTIGYREFAPFFFVTDPLVSLTNTFPSGPSMISFPIRPQQNRADLALLNPSTGLPLFTPDTLLMAQWKANLNRVDGDNYLRSPNMDPLQPGSGYWISLDSPTTVKVTGYTTNGLSQYSIALVHGWNQIGNPYDVPINIADLQFQYLADNIPQDLASAIGKGWIVGQDVVGVSGKVVIWSFDSLSGYVPVQGNATLAPWKGYWIRVLTSEGVTITFPTPAGRSAKLTNTKTRAVPASTEQGWSITLALRSSTGTGSTAVIGQALGASPGYDSHRDALRPPDFSRSIPVLSADHTDWGAASGRYYSDIRPLGSGASWQLTATVPSPGTDYTLTWGAMSNVPRGTRLLLEDVATGRRVAMQSASSLKFNSGQSVTRAFKIIAEVRSQSALRILGVTSRMSRSIIPSVEFAVNLSSPASLTAEIRSADGRVIRRLATGRAVETGITSMAWDARDDKSTSVPSGSYLISITARSSDGDTVRAVQPVIISR